MTRLEAQGCQDGQSQHELQETRKDSFLLPLGGTGPTDTLVLGFWPSELCENKSLLFQASLFGVPRYGSPRNKHSLRPTSAGTAHLDL